MEEEQKSLLEEGDEEAAEEEAVVTETEKDVVGNGVGERGPPTELDALLARTPIIASPSAKSPGRSRSYSDAFAGQRQRQRPGHRRPGHNRTRSSMIWMSLTEGLENIAEGMQAEARLLRGTLDRELRDADEGRTYFLDMSMTRSLSVVPEDIKGFASEAVGKELPPEVSPEQGNVIERYAGLIVAVLAVSSNGPALSLLHGVEPALKLYWRMTATAMVLSFFALRTTLNDPPQLTPMEWLNAVGAFVFYAAHALLFYTALNYTSVALVVTFTNSQALILVVGRVFLGHQVDWLEIGGVLVASTGAILCAVDEVKDPERDNALAMLGNLMGFGSGLMGVGYLTFARSTRSHMSVTAFMFLVMATGSLLVLLYMYVAGFTLSMSRDPHHGLFGWMTILEDRLYIMLHIALVVNVCGTMGFVRAMQYFDNIIIAVATLLEPLLATVIAFVIGEGNLPGAYGWTGNALVALGTLFVVYPSMNKPMEH